MLLNTIRPLYCYCHLELLNNFSLERPGILVPKKRTYKPNRKKDSKHKIRLTGPSIVHSKNSGKLPDSPWHNKTQENLFKIWAASF